MFYDRFMQLCKESKIRPADVSRDLGIGKSTISTWKSKGTYPNAVTLVALAEYFNTTPAYLMGNDLAKEPPSPSWDSTDWFDADLEKQIAGMTKDERFNQFISIFVRLSEEEKKSILDYMDYIHAKNNPKQPDPPGEEDTNAQT